MRKTKTDQPKWRLVWASDTDALWIDANGVYPPELGVLEIKDGSDEGPAYVFRVSCEPCTLTDGVISDNPFHPLYPAWFAEQLGEVAETCEHATIREDLCSADASIRATAYRSLVAFFGAHEFDNYPVEITARYTAQWPRYRRGMRRGKDC